MKRERSKFWNINANNRGVDPILYRIDVLATAKGPLNKNQVDEIFGKNETGFIRVLKNSQIK